MTKHINDRRKLVRSRFLLVSALVIFFLTGVHLTKIDAGLLSTIRSVSTPSSSKLHAVWLFDYQSDVDALPVRGIESSLSGLTWNSDTQTLFGVLNRPNAIVEMSNDGKLLRTIEMEGFSDVEAITWTGNNRYIVTDERQQTVLQVIINKDTQSVNSSESPQITVGIGANGNKGFEGLAWNHETQNAFVAKERDPTAVYEITGFNKNGISNNIRINSDDNMNAEISSLCDDLSGLHYDQKSGHLLVLSDQSQLLSEVTPEGRTISTLPLGNIFTGIAQAEGVTMDDEGNVYIVSEPNLLYRFVKSES